MRQRLLFVCTGNIARSQMAEGLARSMARDGLEVASAGSQPNPQGVHPTAIQALREIGIDISAHQAKSISDLPADFDYVITLCDEAVKHCPVVPARRERLHWSIPDPAVAGTNPEKVLAMFREIRDDLVIRIRELLNARNLLRETR